MPSKYRQLLPPLTAGGAMLGLAVLASCIGTSRSRADESKLAAGMAGTDAVQTDVAVPRRRHRGHSLAMPYFSFAQSLRPRN